MTDRALVTCLWFDTQAGEAATFSCCSGRFLRDGRRSGLRQGRPGRAGYVRHDQVRHRWAGEGLRRPVSLVPVPLRAVEPAVPEARGDRYGEP